MRAVTNFGGSTTVGAYTAVVTGTPNGPITLVSNASETATSGGSSQFLAQSFGTGSHSTGYTVSEVQIYMVRTSGGTTTLRIREDNSGAPGDEVALLMNPGTFTANAFNTFTAPADTVLRGSRTYWLSVNEGISASRMSYGSTSGTGQTGATGWTIADGGRYRGSESASWTTDSFSLRITVKGTANPPNTTAPVFASAAANGTSLVITFDEDLAAAASLANSAFRVKKTTSGATEATVVTLSTTVAPVISGKTVTLTLATALVSTDTGVKVSYTKPTTGTANKLVDAATNETGTFTDQTVINNTVDLTVTSIVRQSPTSSPTKVDTLTWRVTFSEAAQNVDAADFSVDGTTATLAVSAVSGVTGAYDVTATGGNLAILNTTVTLSIAASHNIQSTTSNALTNTDPTGTNDNTFVVDNTPPTLISATMEEERLTISLSEAHESPSGDMESVSFFQALLRQFSVTADGQAVQLHPLISFQPHIVIIGVSQPFVRQGQAVVLSYADPTTGDDAVALQDAAGNETPSFTTGRNRVPAVTNHSTVAAVVPGAPTGLSATVGSTTSIDLSWNAPADNGGRVITGYKVEVSADSGTTWTVLEATTGSTDTTYEHTGLTIGNTRHYRVSAINSVGTGAVSNTDSATTTTVTVPGAPTNLTATAISHSAINLSWTAPANNGGSAITGYKIERHPHGSDWTTSVATTGSTTTTYSSTNLFRETWYFFRVSAINTAGTGAVSNTADALTFISGSSAPTSSNGTVTATEDTDYTFTTADFPVSDADGDLLSYVIITTLLEAGKGTIYFDLAPLRQVPARFVEGRITNGQLKYSPPANSNGPAYASFKFKVEDTARATSASEYTITINVTPVNDAATGRPSITGNSEVGSTLTASTSDIIDVDGLPNSFTYQWKRFAADGTTFEANIGTNSRTYTLTSSEEGKKVKVGVSFTDNGGNSEGPLTSAATPTITLEVQDPVRHEPVGRDFSHDGDTRGFVTVGTVSSGRMSYPEDGDPWADYGDSGWGDMFNLVGLEPRKTYRVEVDFNRVANTVGGSIQMYICCNHGPDPYAVSEWDSNYDGRAIFDFDTGWTVGATFVSVIPSNSMNPDVWEFGSYTVTLTDVTGLRKLVSNTRQRPVTVTYANVGKSTAVTPNTNVQRAIAFTTGGHTDGYTLDRITAYISLTDGTDTGTGAPKVAIHRDGTNKPGAKLCDLQMLADYDTGLSLSNGDWPDRLYASECTLAASTTYWVVFSEDSSPAQTYWVGRANNSEEDPHGASGWSISNSQAGKVGDGDWMPAITGGALAIGVYGTPK